MGRRWCITCYPPTHEGGGRINQPGGKGRENGWGKTVILEVLQKTLVMAKPSGERRGKKRRSLTKRNE